MFSAVLYLDGPFVGTRSVGIGSRIPCRGVHLRCGLRIVVVRRIVHFQTQERFRPFGYAAVGLIGYGVWSLLVFTATINSILAKVGESVLTNGQVGAIALNGAALGFVAFLFAKLLDVKLGNRKTVAIILLSRKSSLPSSAYSS